MYVIAGVSGNTGSVVADTLLTQGKPVRVIVRNADKGEPWRARGAQVAVADLNDADALGRALAAATGVYLLVPPKLDDPDPIAHNRALTRTLAKAVTAAGKPHVVFLSSIGAHHSTGTGPIRALHQGEEDLVATGAALTAIRAGYFMENWGASLGMLGQAVLPSFIALDRHVPMVATRDIGRTAAAALVEGGKGRQTIELAGPRDLTPTDVAHSLSAIVGKTVTPQAAPLDAVVPTFTSFGASPAMAGLYREMLEGIASGQVAWSGDARSVRGTVTIDEVLRGLLNK